ncbi:MAG TPA: ATP-binding protein, partial [Symbiobacteriaceae bacterium]|nr:ATP-binding protein [Symbiobacteriaceae bacterium]
MTELEILHGVLEHPDLAEHAYFYFRDPDYPGTVRDGLGGKLAALKERIRASGRPVTEDYANPEAFGEAVLRDFEALIDRLFPPTEAPDPLAREAQAHAALAGRLTRLFAGRTAYLEALEEHVLGSAQPLVLTGESGVGKSALLAQWSAHHSQQHPDTLVFLHFVGATPDSADWRLLVWRVLGVLAQRLGVKAEVGADAVALRAAFAGVLYQAAARGPVVLVLDGLNQLAADEQALDLVWSLLQQARLVQQPAEATPLLTEAEALYRTC